jgi:hypothetical protein
MSRLKRGIPLEGLTATALRLLRVTAFPFLIFVVLSVTMTTVAVAASPGPGWSIRSIAQPTNFSSGGHDSYALLVSNVGGTPTATGATVTISDVLPEHVHALANGISGEDLSNGNGLSCTSVPLQCVTANVESGDVLLVTIKVSVEEGTRKSTCEVSSPGACNIASVAGGGAPSMSTTEQTTFSSEQAPFGIQGFAFQAFDSDGLPSTQAGGHPYMLATNFDFTTDENGEEDYTPQEVKDIIVDLPPGFVGNPQTLPRCPLSSLLLNSNITACPPGSKIGTVVFQAAPGPGHFRTSERSLQETTSVYNLDPEPGFPAEFGFTFLGKPVYMYASTVRIDDQLRLRVTAPGIPELDPMSVTLLFFGAPEERDLGVVSQIPFFTNPVEGAACEHRESLSATAEVDTWQDPSSQHAHVFPEFAESTTYPQLTGCELLQFQPSLGVQPDATQADEPSGYTFTVANPQNESPAQLGTPELKNATVTLPAGISISPSAADGLRACAATGSEGINIGSGQILGAGNPGAGEDASNEHEYATEVGEGHPGGADPASPYDDGLFHTAPGHCPAASTVGTVEVVTPLLASPLEGHVYVGQPECGLAGQSPCSEADALEGRLFKLYLEAAGSGSIVKLEGKAFVNPTTGQITTSFKENPQVPFSSLKLHLNSGPRAPLANPQSCGPALASADFSPWSAPITPDSRVLAPPFTVDWNDAGETCPATSPLSPALVAGTVSPTAGAFTPFVLTLSRGDRQQDVSQLSVTMPPGLAGIIASVPLCGEPQAARGECSAASEIGTATVAAGAGSHPYWVTGHVYLTGSYNGAPFGLSIVVPAQAGPFNLGSVVVRSAITVNPETAAVTITSSSLPQIIDGVPLRVQTISTDIERHGFIFNPTNCAAKQVTATVTGSQGATAQLSNPFAAAGCKGLAFSPSFAVSTQARTSKEHGASLDVKVLYKPGQANIRSVAVTLPKQLPARLTTIQQACLAATFEANPAACPAGSLIGVVKASTPVLPGQLTGPAYLVSHGGAAFPDVVVILQGDDVRVDLVGNINIAPKTEVTSSTFASVPDVPVTSFEFNLPEGSHSALATNLPAKDKGDLCGVALAMPTTITGQNGSVIKQSTKVAVTGCPKAKKKVKKKAKAKPRARRGSASKHVGDKG